MQPLFEITQDLKTFSNSLISTLENEEDTEKLQHILGPVQPLSLQVPKEILLQGMRPSLTLSQEHVEGLLIHDWGPFNAVIRLQVS